MSVQGGCNQGQLDLTVKTWKLSCPRGFFSSNWQVGKPRYLTTVGSVPTSLMLLVSAPGCALTRVIGITGGLVPMTVNGVATWGQLWNSREGMKGPLTIKPSEGPPLKLKDRQNSHLRTVICLWERKDMVWKRSEGGYTCKNRETIPQQRRRSMTPLIPHLHVTLSSLHRGFNNSSQFASCDNSNDCNLHLASGGSDNSAVSQPGAPTTQVVLITLIMTPQWFNTWDFPQVVRTEEAPWMRGEMLSRIYNQV